MNIMRIILTVWLSLLACAVHAQSQVDKSVLPITAQELTQGVQHTPLDSNIHNTLISRAFFSNLSRIAYEEYTDLWLKAPNSAYTNLWRASASTMLVDAVMMRQVQDLPLLPTRLDSPEVLAQSQSASSGSNRKPDKRLEPLALARYCFAQAIKLNPDSAVINLEEGFYLWQWDNKMEEGLKMMKHALEMSPDDPMIHLRLAEVYMNHTGNAYSLDRSLGELKTVLRLAPSLSATHSQLMKVWLRKEDYDKAEAEMQIYLHMIPEHMKHRWIVKIMQEAIDTGLNSRKRQNHKISTR